MRASAPLLLAAIVRHFAEAVLSGAGGAYPNDLTLGGAPRVKRKVTALNSAEAAA